ncbi:PREDICTED: putative pumilio homolog 13 [Tarenaya hassleriana]|uniref:putative pumilio homolog 13 n=1 Tax=Tarenaya hassleriana TaxID=28532 RepID=UPI00053C463F|nr:PREDICTED: putative pumilio homolog 13 [Tarenaya hassleriana]
MDATQRNANGRWIPETVTQPAPASNAGRGMLSVPSIDFPYPYFGAQWVSPLDGLEALESRFSRVGLSDSNVPHHHPQSQPPLWNSKHLNQGFVDRRMNTVRGYRVSLDYRLETERERMNRLHRLRYQNDYANGSFRFDASRDSSSSSSSSSLMGQDRVLRNGFRNGNLGEVPYRSRNSATVQRPTQFDFAALVNSQGDIVRIAQHRSYSSHLRNSIKNGSRDMFNMIFDEVIPHICQLMVDPFGHNVVDELVEGCSEGQITQILDLLTRCYFQLIFICNQSHRAHTIQTFIRCLKSPQQKHRFMTAISRISLQLIKNANGCHVIYYCLSKLGLEFNMPIVEAVAKSFYEIALDQYGCCVVQQCISHSPDEVKQYLIGEIILNALPFSSHCYGNYLVQFVVTELDDGRTEDLLRRLGGCFSALSRDKYGSHVVEKLLKDLKEEFSRRIQWEVLRDARILLVHPNGNFVMQTTWKVSQDDIRNKLKAYILENIQVMRCNKFGKKVLNKIKNF